MNQPAASTTGGLSERHWASVTWIALGAFALIFAEFLPVGMLAEMSRTFRVGTGTEGLAVTATAITAAIAAPLVALVVREIDRKTVLVALTCLLVVSSGISLFTSNFEVFLLARLILGIGIGGFWSVAIAAAARLVPAERVGKSTTVVLGAISIGTVLSVPIGALIAESTNWHVAYGAAIALGLVVLIVQLLGLPSIPAQKAVRIGDFVGLLRSPRTVVILAVVVCIVGGHFAAYTFISPFLRGVVGVGDLALPSVLFGFGVLAVLGNFVGGAVASRGPQGFMLVTAGVLALALVLISCTPVAPFVAFLGLALWALAWGAAPLATQLLLFDAAVAGEHSIEAAQALNTTVFQLSIAVGSLAGSIAVTTGGVRSSEGLGAVLLVLALAVVVTLTRAPSLSIARKRTTA